MSNSIYSALAKAQGDFPRIPRDKTVVVQKKTGGSYKFAYAPLDTILGLIRPVLSANGLSLAQTVSEGDLVSTLYHESGQTLEARCAIVGGAGGPQEYGSALTYARRYSLTLLLALAADEDDDANVAEGNTATPVKKSGATVLVEQGKILDSIRNARNLLELKQVGAQIAASTATLDTELLKSAYFARRDELKSEVE